MSSMLRYLRGIGSSLADAAAERYRQAVGRELRRFGLRYDDLLDPLMDLVREWLGHQSIAT